MIAIFLAISMMFSGSAPHPSDYVTPTTSLPSIGPVVTPQLIKDFARREPEFISLAARQTSQPKLLYSTELLKTLTEVNNQVNASVTWTSDEDVWGEEDNWDFPCQYHNHLFDDCDSFALLKLKLLLEKGLPSTPFMFVTGYDELGEGHAILVVSTTAGDFVLDNRFAAVMSVPALIKRGYNFLWRSGSAEHLDGAWVRMATTSVIPPFTPPMNSGAQKPPLCRPRPFRG